MPSSLGVVFIMARGSRRDGRPSSRPASVVASGLLQTASTDWLQRAGSRSAAAAPPGGGLRPPEWLGPWREQRGLALGVAGAAVTACLGAQAPTQRRPPNRRVPAHTDLRPHEALRGGGVTHLAAAPSGRAAGADHAAARARAPWPRPAGAVPG